MGRPSDLIFKDAAYLHAPTESHQNAAIKTYRYLRLGMLVAVAALSYSILEEHQQRGVHCFLGSISGYYYTPVRPVFVGVMIAIGLALLVIKGRTPYEDAFLSLAGVMAPIVALIPTSDDTNGVCRPLMLHVNHYQPDPGSLFVKASIRTDLHAFWFAGCAALFLVLLAFVVQRLRGRPLSTYTAGFWVNFGGGCALAVAGFLLLRFAYSWVLQGHAYAACAMFVFLAAAAITNCVFGFAHGHTKPAYATIYGVVGGAMLVAGLLFVLYQGRHRSALGGHLVLWIEAVEILLFVIFWATQTIERWNTTV